MPGAATRTIDVAERRSRLGRRHRLAAAERADGVLDAAAAVVALHGTDAATVYLAVRARMRDATVEAIDRALYDERSLLRMLCMRRTMFVVPMALAPAVQVASGRPVAAQQRRVLLQLLAESGIDGDADAWLSAVSESALAALTARGEAFAADLAEDEPRLRHQLLLAPGKAYEAKQNVSTRVLLVLGAEGHIVRARPRGGWTSTQYRWTPTGTWLPGGLPDVPPDEARARVAREWLARFGPGTPADLRWWTGWTAGDVRRSLADAGAVEVDLGGVRGMVLADDVEPVAEPEPWAALLPALDPTSMGWMERSWYLGEHGPKLFDATGNCGPTVWWEGRVIGGWAQRADGEIVYRLLEDAGAEARAAVEAEAARLSEWLGPVRLAVRARQRTPVERELLA